MSTSPSRALEPTASEPVARFAFQPFPYDPAEEKPAVLTEVDRPAAPLADLAAQRTAEREAQLRAGAKREGQAEAQKVFEEKLARERSGIAAALAQFTRDRAAYFQKVEGELVQLSLSIAHRILHREAQLDPLLLAGLVRVALEKIDGATGVLLRVHPQNSTDWRRYLATHLEPADLPEIIEDAAQPLDCCVLETKMGTALLGLEVQLKEIEQGLMDLLSARPGASR